jgi:hypothetical protein
MKDELAAIGDGEARAFAEKFIGLLGKSGLSKEKASKLLGGLAEIQRPEDPKVFFAKELEKLGPDGKEIIGRMRRFRDAMRDSKEFDEEEIAELERAPQPGEGLWGALQCSMRPGRSPYGPCGLSSHADRIAMYEKAYALHRTNPSESRAEIARLDRMFAK